MRKRFFQVYSLIFFLIFCTSNLFSNTNIKHFSSIESKIQLSKNTELVAIQNLLKGGNTKSALTKLYVFIDNAKNNKNTKNLNEGYLMLADILRDNADYSKSTEIFRKALPFINGDLNILQFVYFKIGGNFQRDQLVDSAKVNYLKALKISNKLQNNDELRAKINANLSGIYYLQANYPKAIEHSKIAANFQRKIGNKEIEAGILNNLGGIYYMQGNYKEALKTFNEAFSIVGYGQDDLQKKTRSTAYINLAYAYSGLGNFEKAFEFQDRYFSLNDTLQKELKYKEIAEIEAKYNIANNEKFAEIERSKRLKTEYWLYSLSFFTLILLVTVYSLYKVYKLNKKNYELVIEQKQLIHEKKIEQLKRNTQEKMLIATLDGRLQERKQIAQTLHDNVSALLSAANLHLFASTKKMEKPIPTEIEKTKAIISEASEKIRDLSHTLVSSVLLKFGLNVAVQDICSKSSNSSLQINCEMETLGRFNQDFEMKIYNIVSELINNVLKHSNATVCTVKLRKKSKIVELIVEDNGVGFNRAAIEEQNGFGLLHMHAQITAMKGSLHFQNLQPGTIVQIEVPFVNVVPIQ